MDAYSRKFSMITINKLINKLGNITNDNSSFVKKKTSSTSILVRNRLINVTFADEDYKIFFHIQKDIKQNIKKIEIKLFDDEYSHKLSECELKDNSCVTYYEFNSFELSKNKDYNLLDIKNKIICLSKEYKEFMFNEYDEFHDAKIEYKLANLYSINMEKLLNSLD